jgi:pimeloyl-ACP methyl ester carboxylesterase
MPLRFLLAPLACALALSLSSCALFEKTCEEDDRECLGPGPGFGAGLGGECTITADCKEGLTCDDDNTCQALGLTKTGARCRLTAECGDADYCGSQRICLLAGIGSVDDECEDTGDCRHGLVCEGPDLAQTGVVSLDQLATTKGSCEQGGELEQGEKCDSIVDCLAGLYCLEIEQAGTDKICTNLPVIVPAPELPPIPDLWDGVGCPPIPDSAPKQAVFDLPRSNVDQGDDFYGLPFPNDILRDEDGHADLSMHPSPPEDLGIPFVNRYVDVAAEDLDGYSTNAVAIFRFSHKYDGKTVSGDSGKQTVRIVNITKGTPEYNMDGGLQWKTTVNKVSRYVCPHFVALARPLGNPLLPNTTYAAIITTGVKPTDGGEFERSDDFVALLSDDEPDDGVVADAWEKYAPLRAWLDDSNTDADTILNATVFTTHDPEASIRGLRQAVIDDGVASISDLTNCSDPEETSPCHTQEMDEDGTVEERGACVGGNTDYTEIHGRIKLPIFQKGTLPYLAPGDDGQEGAIQLDSQGRPIVQDDADVCMSISVPDSPPPAEGYPVLIYSHGTGGSFTNPLRGGLAQELANASTPAVVIAIDLPEHGERRGASTKKPDELFYNFLNPRAARDNVLQGSADLFGVVQWVAEEAGISALESPTDEAVPFNPDRIVMMGHSQGATHTALMISYEPRASAVVLSGVGGHLTSSLLAKKSPVDIAKIVPLGLMDPNDDFKLAAERFNPALAIIQSVFDSVDPINFAKHLRRNPTDVAPNSQHAFVTYGVDDTYSPETTQLAYALAAQLVLVTPVIVPPAEVIDETSLSSVAPGLRGNESFAGTTRTIGMRQYAATTTMTEIDESGDEVEVPTNGHFVAISPGEDGREDVLRFLEQALGSDTPPQIGEP